MNDETRDETKSPESPESPESATRLAECMGRWAHHWVWVWVNGCMDHCECSTCGETRKDQL